VAFRPFDRAFANHWRRGTLAMPYQAFQRWPWLSEPIVFGNRVCGGAPFYGPEALRAATSYHLAGAEHGIYAAERVVGDIGIEGISKLHPRLLPGNVHGARRML